VTTAAFGEPGTYGLRLSVNDGASTMTDDLIVTVTGAAAPPRIEAVEYLTGSPATVEIRFSGEPGTYLVQSRDAVDLGAWQTRTEATIPAGGGSQRVAVPIPPGQAAGFYRLSRGP
jgi:hypothetical protein